MLKLSNSTVEVRVFSGNVSACGEAVSLCREGSHFGKILLVVLSVDFLLVFEFSDFFFFHFKDFFKDAVFIEFVFNRVDSEPDSFILLFQSLFLVLVDVEGLVNLEEIVLFGLKFLS